MEVDHFLYNWICDNFNRCKVINLNSVNILRDDILKANNTTLVFPFSLISGFDLQELDNHKIRNE